MFSNFYYNSNVSPLDGNEWLEPENYSDIVLFYSSGFSKQRLEKNNIRYGNETTSYNLKESKLFRETLKNHYYNN